MSSHPKKKIPSKMVHGASLSPKGDIGALRGEEAMKLFPKVKGKHVSASSYYSKNKVRQENG